MRRLASYLTKIWLLAGLLLTVSSANATLLTDKETNQNISKLYRVLSSHAKNNITDRLDLISNHFLGKAYLLGALGEGENAPYDQSPLYRTDSFDCETYVDTVVALAIANNPNTFKACISKIRYAKGKVNFLTRNHFSSLDWNINNQNQGFTKDITKSIKDGAGNSVAVMAEAVIDKPSWYQHLLINRIKIKNATPEESAQRLEELKKLGQNLPVELAKIPYIPLSVLFDEQAKPNKEIFKQIPSGSIIEIVRPNWDLTKEIGTHLNVSHMGLVFWKGDNLIFRQASSTQHQVIEVPLEDYLKETRASPTIKGINIQIVDIKAPLVGNCSP